MDNSQIQDNPNKFKREGDRHRIHVLATIKKFKWMPFFGTYSGVILNISDSGLKVSFSGEVYIKPFSSCSIKIPLTPLEINNPQCFQAKIEVKWFDTRNYRLGGLFLNLSNQQKQVLKKIITALEENDEDYDQRKKTRSYLPKSLH